MGSRLRTDVRHLIECFCEIVSPTTATQGSSSQPWVVQKFPDSFRDDEMLKQVALFSFPCNTPCNTVQHFSFVLTSLDSKWTFGFCRQAPGAQTALVVISYLPWHEFFFKILNQIAELMQEQSGGAADLNSFLEAIFQRDVPAPSTTLHIPYGRAHRVYTCKCPNTYTLPSIPENRNLTEYFNAVDAHNMMIIFASMLHERRIVMVSSRISRLSACIQAANAVIYPMIWQHIYIPVLPPHLMDYLLAPMPYLAGVPASTWERVRKSELGETVVLDVDTNRIETPFDDLESLPPDIVSGMRRRLKTPGTMMGDGVARVFLRALVQLIGGYRDALRFRQGEQITFCRDALIQSRPPPLRPFLESMLQLQIFQQFIEERLEMLNSGQGFSDEFELEACLYSDKSSSRLKQQYKEWLSTMKKGSGALFKKANPAMRNAVKTVGRLAKETSKTAYKEVRSKWKDMQTVRELEEAGHGQLNHKPRSAPSSPKPSAREKRWTAGRLSPNETLKRTGMPPGLLERASHSLRRCETSVTHAYHMGTVSGPGYQPQESSGLDGLANCSSRSSSSGGDEGSGGEDELHMLPLDLGNLMDDMKDVLSRTSVSSSPPAVDRSRKPSLSSPPVSPVTGNPPIHRQTSAPSVLLLNHSSKTPVQALPLPPPRSRKRSDVPTSHAPKAADLIRLDSSTSLSPVEEFDPLSTRSFPSTLAEETTSPSSASPAMVVPLALSNPVYTYHHLPSNGGQTAEPQAPPSSRNNGNHSTPPPPPTGRRYVGRSTAGPDQGDPFSNLLAFTRANLVSPPDLPVSPPRVINKNAGANAQVPHSSLAAKSSWTTFD